MNILIPCAGSGSRFKSAGYYGPKPLIPVNGKAMIEKVVDNIGLHDGKHVFIIQQKESSNIYLNLAVRVAVVEINGITEGAACTVLKAIDEIDNKKELIIANSDQLVLDKDFMKTAMIYFAKKDADGGIICFLNDNPKWSYVKINGESVSEVVEKKVVSNIATVGIYYYKEGRMFVDAAKRMIEKNVRVNNEFYVAPVFNEMILDGLKIYPYMVNEMWGLGTPEDLKAYENYCSQGK